MKLIYVLELENNKYYVGKTSRIEKRFKNHLNGEGSQFTKKYKPIKIYRVYKKLSEFDEDNYTKKYMKLFGIDNVRGGSYCNIVLSKYQIDLLNKELCTTNNTCYRCGRDTHLANFCYANTHIDGSNLNYNKKIICYRCGRDTHYERNCYANTHINGRYLNDTSLIAQFRNLSLNDTLHNTISVAKSIFRYFKY